jgi:sulfite reductase (ferredoxin)
VHLGLMGGEQMLAIAELAESFGGDVRVTRQQNLVLAAVPDAELHALATRLASLGFPLDAHPLRGAAIACTGEPHCNFSVTETKSRAGELIEHLEERFGAEIGGLKLHLDGCPHACAQHWVGDLGFQGTTVRDAAGKRRQAYDVFLRGGLAPAAAIARPVFRRVPTEELDTTVDRLVAGWLALRRDAEDFRAFCDRMSDEELGILAGREATAAREKEAA